MTHAMMQGEFTLAHALVRRLHVRDVTCLAGTTRREVIESPFRRAFRIARRVSFKTVAGETPAAASCAWSRAVEFASAGILAYYYCKIYGVCIEMIRMTEADLQQGLGALAERARHEPVTITKDGRDDLVVLSAEEYARLKRRDRRVGLTEDLPEE